MHPTGVCTGADRIIASAFPLYSCFKGFSLLRDNIDHAAGGIIPVKNARSAAPDDLNSIYSIEGDKCPISPAQIRLIDTPPVTSVTDPVIIAGLVDTILFVIKHNYVDKRIVRDSLATLNKANADIMGAVLNDLDVKKMNYYSYQSYYRYYSDSEAK